MQGHSASGVYARAFMLGRLSQDQMDNFRQESMARGIFQLPASVADARFLAVADGIDGPGPLMGIYQARFLKYLPPAVPPTPKGARSGVLRRRRNGRAGITRCHQHGWPRRSRQPRLRHQLQPQRLDGPVRGNGKIIQELRRRLPWFRLERHQTDLGRLFGISCSPDRDGTLVKRMEEVIDGEYQVMKARDGAYVREHFRQVSATARNGRQHVRTTTSGASIRGGHDPHKILRRLRQRGETQRPADGHPRQDDQRRGHGHSGEALNIAHQAKKMDLESLRQMRDRFQHPGQDAKTLASYPYCKPASDSPEGKYMRERREGAWRLPAATPHQERQPADAGG